MAQTKKITPSVSKKQVRHQIDVKLETALANLIPVLGKKKFKRRIKKARKLLTHGLNKGRLDTELKSAELIKVTEKSNNTRVIKK